MGTRSGLEALQTKISIAPCRNRTNFLKFYQPLNQVTRPIPFPVKEFRVVMIFQMASLKRTDDDGFSSISTSKFATVTEKISRKPVWFIN
jgi:hypothetical protein